MTGFENYPKAMPRVMVVNDSFTQLNLLCGLLKKAGLDSIPFTSAETALAAMEESSPLALIITDLYMPGIDGWRFCRLLRSPDYMQSNRVPILVVSATFSGDEPARITSELGANAFLPMPVDGQQFIEQVRTLLKGENPQQVLKVLIVEDDRLISNRLVKAFQAHNYLADTAFTYREGQAQIGQVDYDVAVMDYHLPDGLGDMLLSDLQEKSPDCVCLMMTADPRPELALKWMKLGAAAYVQKPFELEYLIAQCDRARRERALIRIQDLLEVRTRQLQKSEERFHHAMEASCDGLWDWDISSDEVYYSPAYLGMLGYLPEELPASIKTWFNLIHPEDCETTMAANQACIQNDIDQFDIEFRMQAQDGSWRWIRSQGKAVRRDANGQALQIIGTHADITERKQSEATIRAAEEKYRDIFENATEGIFQSTPDGRFLSVNPAMARIFGFESPAEMIAQVGNQIEHKIHAQPGSRSRFMSLVETGSVDSFEALNTRKDGSLIWTRTNGRAVRNEQGDILYYEGFLSDISERKRLDAVIESRLLALTRPLDQPEGIKFEELFDLKAIQRLQDDFSTATGVASIITDPDGTPITQPSNFCRLCSGIIRKTEQGQINCFKSDALIGRYHPEGPAIQPCMSGGLWDGGAGISVGGRHIANWLIGQVRDETQTEEHMRDYARQIGADETAFIEAYKDVPAMPQIQFQQISNVLFTLANQLSTSAYQNVQQARFISAQKKAEALLKESEENYRSISENSFDLISLLDVDGCYRYCNVSYTRILGYTPDELIGCNGFDLIHPDEKEELWQLLQSVLADRQLAQEISARRILNRVRCRDGSYKWIEHRYRMLLDELGNINQILLNAQDITERKRVEDALRLSEEKFSTAFRISPDSININRLRDGMYIEINEGFSTLTGYLPEEVVGRTSMELNIWANPQDREQLVKGLREKGEVINLEAPFQVKNGIIKICLMSARVIEINQEKCILSMTRDITERKQAEEALRESEVNLSSIINKSHDAIGVSKEGIHVLANPAYVTLFGYGSEVEVLNKSVLDLIAPSQRSQILNKMQQRARGEPIPDYYETRGLRKDGSEFEMEVAASTYILKNEIQTLVILRDISERKQAEQELRESENRYRTLFEQGPDGVVILNPETGQIIEFNGRACQQLGFSRDEFSKLNVADIEVIESAKDVKSHIQNILTVGHADFETQQRTKQGEIRDIQVIAQVIEAGEHVIYQCIWRDITERKQTETKINEQLEELRRWHNITMGREDRILQLKKEVNRLLAKTGKPARYASAVEEDHE